MTEAIKISIGENLIGYMTWDYVKLFPTIAKEIGIDNGVIQNVTKALKQ